MPKKKLIRCPGLNYIQIGTSILAQRYKVKKKLGFYVRMLEVLLKKASETVKLNAPN